MMTSEEYSTVWDGDQTLFEFNFLVLDIDPDECFKLANKEHLPFGRELRVNMAEHFS
jgi:hypothetical protein